MIMNFSDCQCHPALASGSWFFEIYRLRLLSPGVLHPAIEKRSPAEIRFEGCARRLIKI